MSNSSKKTVSGAENINWDLSDLYKSSNDPQLQKDKKEVLTAADDFAKKYKGRIEELSVDEFKELLKEYEAIQDLGGKIGSFAYLQWSTNTGNSEFGKLVQESNELS